ncbi:aminotransferase class III-fold pyridoxal phosphate-dependent enzyme [Pseudoalteromonas byunsanensis]|uniref:Aspartate aminotransferase family protein n=1 Tax=Pseudoalteromonas byunsanensis TaxID=327939 RepID=A0A1S1N6U9_9GAMM|nr:aminotransferase class III-fold pyridoxal phosphate-dependent enzyme [Pseudoalteromonas byunsanensis]OHU95194.1 hypothetical protein BIW53_10740 [Pseudoalteromonas byunsanensis]
MSSPLLYPSLTSDAPYISSGDGAWLYDEQGKSYIDGSSGVMISNIGHGNEDIAQIASEQIKKVAFAYRSHFRNRHAEDLASKLVELSQDKSHVFFLNSGSEANDAAVRVAIQYWQELGYENKKFVLGRNVSNHGNTIATLSVAQNKRREEIEPLWLSVTEHKLPACYCYRCPLGKSPDSCQLECAQALEKQILELGAENVAAFVAEPITAAAGGVLIPHDGYFAQIRRICDEHNILLIVDEVVTGLGRTGTWFGMHHFNVSSDISVLGKGLNAGYTPLSAVMINQRIYDVIAAGSHNLSIGHTHSGNPLSTAIASGVVDYLVDSNMPQVVKEKGVYLRDKLDTIAAKYPYVGDVRAIGLLSAIEFVQDKQTREMFPSHVQLSKRISAAALKHGLVLYPCRGLQPGERGDAMLIAPPLNSTYEELEALFQRLDLALQEVFSELGLRL